jgi:hypothetical protein
MRSPYTSAPSISWSSSPPGSRRVATEVMFPRLWTRHTIGIGRMNVLPAPVFDSHTRPACVELLGRHFNTAAFACTRMGGGGRWGGDWRAKSASFSTTFLVWVYGGSSPVSDEWVWVFFFCLFIFTIEM